MFLCRRGVLSCPPLLLSRVFILSIPLALRRGPKLSVSWILGLGDIHASRHAAQCCINCCRCTFEPKQAECGCRVVRLCASVDCADSGGV